MFDYREELECAVDCAREAMPDDVRAAIGECKASLYCGPSAGEWSAPLVIVAAWAESVDDVILTDFIYSDDGEDWEEGEVGRIDSRDIISAIAGKELVGYL